MTTVGCVFRNALSPHSPLPPPLPPARFKNEHKIPKKTKLYVEQIQREKLQAGHIHRAFQQDLCRLRLTAARAYVDTITDGRHGVSAVGGVASLRLHALCQGLVRDEGTGGGGGGSAKVSPLTTWDSRLRKLSWRI